MTTTLPNCRLGLILGRNCLAQRFFYYETFSPTLFFFKQNKKRFLNFFRDSPSYSGKRRLPLFQTPSCFSRWFLLESLRVISSWLQIFFPTWCHDESRDCLWPTSSKFFKLTTFSLKGNSGFFGEPKRFRKKSGSPEKKLVSEIVVTSGTETPNF